jgi:ribosome-associated translation inhibitor RaiA
MQVRVRGRHVDMSEPFRGYAERRVQFAIGAFERRLDHIDVCVDDINGPRGGVDKSCVLKVSLKSGGTVLVRGADADVYSAVDRAAARIKSALGRRLGARADWRRGQRRASV